MLGKDENNGHLWVLFSTGQVAIVNMTSFTQIGVVKNTGSSNDVPLGTLNYAFDGRSYLLVARRRSIIALYYESSYIYYNELLSQYSMDAGDSVSAFEIGADRAWNDILLIGTTKGYLIQGKLDGVFIIAGTQFQVLIDTRKQINSHEIQSIKFTFKEKSEDNSATRKGTPVIILSRKNERSLALYDLEDLNLWNLRKSYLTNVTSNLA